jgi:F-type H+-transporting ATPase subunit b
MRRAVLASTFAVVSVASGDLMTFDVPTVLVEIALFLLLVALLRVIVFKPLLAVLEARDRAIDGARAEAEQRVREADRRVAEYEARLDDVRAKAAAERDALRAQGRAEETRILEAAKAETTRAVDEGKAAVRREADALRRELDVQIPSLAASIASRALGRDPSRPS